MSTPAFPESLGESPFGARPSTRAAPTPPRLLDRASFEDAVRGARGDGLIAVEVSAQSPADRGKLALLIEEAVEQVLERHGACPPGLTTESDLDASLSDQIYRARLLEYRGLLLAIGPLATLATPAGALDVEDSATLRFLCGAAERHPVRVVLAIENAELGVYDCPRALRELLRDDAFGSAVYDAPARSDAFETLEHEPVPAGDLARALVMALSEAAPEQAPASDDDGGDSVSVAPGGGEDPASAAPTPGTESGDPPPAAEPPSTPDAAPVQATEAPLFAEEPPETSQIRPAPLGPLHERAAEAWPGWVRELEGARGPKPLASVERMFAKSYVPLRDAWLRGIAAPEVEKVLEGWATSFAKSYAETWSALRVRTKRPTMVLDVPDVALRIGRLHGARSVQLLLVDGLRFDLGLRLEALLRARLGHELALTERLLLWSALPSDTATQLELLGRGPDALRGLERAGDGDVTVARGRMARVPRRIKAGHRELLKLDLVEAELSEPGGTEPERLDALAEPLTDSIAELCEKLPTRTLLVVFGDHGFVFEKRADGTTAARQGGSRPEEVLVPALAWLVGGVQ